MPEIQNKTEFIWNPILLDISMRNEKVVFVTLSLDSFSLIVPETLRRKLLICMMNPPGILSTGGSGGGVWETTMFQREHGGAFREANLI